LSLNSIDLYGESFQIKVISALLTHDKFLTNIYDILEPEYFSKQSDQWIIREILKYFEKYHFTISMEVLKIELQKVENDILKIAIKERLKKAYVTSKDDLEYVTEEFSSFCKNQQLKKALLKSVDLLKAGDYDSIRNLVDGALKSGQDKNIGLEYKKNIEERYREEYRKPVPTPWEAINNLLQGGLGNGDFGMIFGNPGGGKSWTLIALGGQAVKLGYNVIHYSLELGESYVGRRYDSYFTEIPVNIIKEHKEEVDSTISQLKGKLIIKEFPPYKTTVSTIEAHLSKLKDFGIEPDLVLIDYADLLGTKKRTNDRKEEIDNINVRIKGMAKELNIPIWSVSQINRTGARENVIEGNSVAGSYDKNSIIDFGASLSRKKEDKLRGIGRFHIMKNRYGMDGMTYNANVDTSTGRIEILNEYSEEDKDNNTSFQSTNNSQPLYISNDKNKLAEKFFELNSLKE